MIRFQGITIDRWEKKVIVCHDGKSGEFHRVSGRLVCALLLAGPTTRTALFDLLYDDREDGGPDSGLEIIDVMLFRIKPRLAALNLELFRDGFWGRWRYWAAPRALPQALEAAE